MKESGCATAFTSSDIYIYSDYYVTAERDVAAGYSYTICIECSSPYQTVQKDGWVISLVGCGNSMTVPSESPTAITLTYTTYSWDDEHTIQTDWDSYF